MASQSRMPRSPSTLTTTGTPSRRRWASLGWVRTPIRSQSSPRRHRDRVLLPRRAVVQGEPDAGDHAIGGCAMCVQLVDPPDRRGEPDDDLVGDVVVAVEGTQCLLEQTHRRTLIGSGRRASTTRRRSTRRVRSTPVGASPIGRGGRRPCGPLRSRRAAARPARSDSSARQHLVRKRQPDGGLIGVGGSPWSTIRCGCVRSAGRESGPPRAARPCTDAPGRWNSSATGAISTILPRYITAMRSLRWRTTDRSWAMNR